jgi:hypothetical protein
MAQEHPDSVLWAYNTLYTPLASVIPKEEGRSEKKFLKSVIRPLIVEPLESYIDTAAVTSGITQAFESCALKTFSAYGVGMYHGGWNSAIHRLWVEDLLTGPIFAVSELDLEECDFHLTAGLLLYVFKGLADLVPAIEKDLFLIWTRVCACWMVMPDGRLRYKRCGNTTGCGLTTLINTVACAIGIYYALIRATKTWYPEVNPSAFITAHTRLLIYGDDANVSQSQKGFNCLPMNLVLQFARHELNLKFKLPVVSFSPLETTWMQCRSTIVEGSFVPVPQTERVFFSLLHQSGSDVTKWMDHCLNLLYTAWWNFEAKNGLLNIMLWIQDRYGMKMPEIPTPDEMATQYGVVSANHIVRQSKKLKVSYTMCVLLCSWPIAVGFKRYTHMADAPHENFAQKICNPFGDGLSAGPSVNVFHKLATHVRPQRSTQGLIPWIGYRFGTITVGAGGAFVAKPGICQDGTIGIAYATGASTTVPTVPSTITALEGATLFADLTDAASTIDVEASGLKVWATGGNDQNGALYGGSSTVPIYTGAAFNTFATHIAEAKEMGQQASKGITVRRNSPIDDVDTTQIASRTTFHATAVDYCTEEMPFVVGQGFGSGDILMVACVIYGTVAIELESNCLVRLVVPLPSVEGMNHLFSVNLKTPMSVGGHSFKKILEKVKHYGPSVVAKAASSKALMSYLPPKAAASLLAMDQAIKFSKTPKGKAINAAGMKVVNRIGSNVKKRFKK